MRKLVVLLWVLASIGCVGPQLQMRAGLTPGSWHAWLDSPGGPLPFGIELERGDAGMRAFLVNGPERIEVESVEFEDNRLTLGIDHYDSRIEAELSEDGHALEGRWWKTAGPDRISELPFHATFGARDRFDADGSGDAGEATVAGRWQVDFAEDELPAVGLFESGDGDEVSGTFLTATGDYRFLAGSFSGDRLRLSVFDGAHAFLFDARLQDDGTLAGDFWSRDSWHEAWTARRDDEAAVPDPLAQTHWTDDNDFGDVAYPDLDGNLRRLDDPEFAGRARIIEVFGSWCPNCNDATAYLVELQERYGDRGLAILGLAFEMTGELQRDSEQLRTYIDYHDIRYPILLAGLSDKGEASKAFPLIDRVRSYPTTIFIDADGQVRAVYSGFSGPATGPAYDELRLSFEQLIETMLEERG